MGGKSRFLTIDWANKLGEYREGKYSFLHQYVLRFQRRTCHSLSSLGINMPTVHREDSFRVVIYPNDHLPRHVHVFKAGAEVIIQLGSETQAPLLDQIYGAIGNKEVAQALKIVRIKQLKLIAAWKKIHG